VDCKVQVSIAPELLLVGAGVDEVKVFEMFGGGLPVLLTAPLIWKTKRKGNFSDNVPLGEDLEILKYLEA
jgi:predicted Rdx family selenoprotein